MAKRKTTDYSPDPSNANTGTERGLRALDDSLAKYGAGRSILVDKNGYVIAGNKTLERAVDLGIENVIEVDNDGHSLVAVRRTDLDLLNDPKARELAYADNRVAEMDLTWNVEQLLADLNAGVDLSAMWREDELAELLTGLVDDAPADPGAQVDKAAELQQKWGVARGDLWRCGKHLLLCGDSTNAEDVARVMAGERAQLTLTDPPYNVGIDYGEATDDKRTDSDYVQWCRDWIAHCSERKVITVGIKKLLLWDDIAGHPQWIIAWVKPNGQSQTGFGGTNKWDAVLTYACPVDHQIDTLEINNDYSEKLTGQGMHVVPKPVELFKALIDRFSDRGNVIYDPFLGSGTGIVAAHQINRRCFGLEIEPSYCAVILDRLERMGLEPERV